MKIIRINKKKHNKIVKLAGSKLNSTEILTSQTLIDLEIIHEEYKTIIIKKTKRRLKENIRMIKSDEEKDELNEEEGKII